MTIDEAVALYRKGRIAAFTFDPDSIDMSYVERDVAEFRKGWAACVLNSETAISDRIAQLESEIAELRKVVEAAKAAVDNRNQIGGYHYTEKLIAAIAAAESKGEE